MEKCGRFYYKKEKWKYIVFYMISNGFNNINPKNIENKILFATVVKN